ncbi:hypothetical protein X975_21157, partial [Stegodyphus mimosarum]
MKFRNLHPHKFRTIVFMFNCNSYLRLPYTLKDALNRNYLTSRHIQT